ncbi:hypothetical protein U1Q18_051438 [Sarracenia purpurea var. burkii]
MSDDKAAAQQRDGDIVACKHLLRYVVTTRHLVQASVDTDSRSTLRCKHRLGVRRPRCSEGDNGRADDLDDVSDE